MEATRLSPTGIRRTADDWIERVRAASDIVEIVSQTIALKRVGRNWVGLCPFHQEKTASFSVHAERQFYHCFSCKAGGDVFKFVAETEKIGFIEAAELLSRRAGIPIPERRAGERSRRAPLLEALEAAAALYESWLGDPATGSATRTYLEKRGLEWSTVRAFRLGFSLPGWENLSQKLRGGFPEETLIEAGLAVRREGRGTGLYDRFRNRLMVPLVSTGGQVVGFGARALAAADEPKYLNSPETAVYHKGAFLYGLDQARRHADPEGEMVLVEGYFDCIALHQSGIGNTVATSGTALTPDQARVLRRAAGRVALTYDGDEAGRGAMMRSLGVLLGEGFDVVVVDLPPGEDPDSLIQKRGVAGWEEARRRALDPILFIERHGLRSSTAGDARERALQAVVRLVSEVDDPIRLELLLDRAVQVFGIAKPVLERAVSLRSSGQRSARPIEAAVSEEVRTEAHLERELLQALLASPGSLESVRVEIAPEDFRDPACAALARRLWSDAPEEDPIASRLARELQASTFACEDPDATIRAIARRLVSRRLAREKRSLSQRHAELAQQGRDSEPEALDLRRREQELAEKISQLNR
jgi:DNA primase